jgi:hypothetical protein
MPSFENTWWGSWHADESKSGWESNCCTVNKISGTSQSQDERVTIAHRGRCRRCNCWVEVLWRCWLGCPILWSIYVKLMRLADGRLSTLPVKSFVNYA